jgi:hypothetical protein
MAKISPYVPSPEALGILNDESTRGVGAATLLKTLGPLLEKRLEQLLTALDQAEPDLNKLLDLRAKILIVRLLCKELHQTVTAGLEAGERLSQL